jgi:hypothetical protein
MQKNSSAIWIYFKLSVLFILSQTIAAIEDRVIYSMLDIAVTLLTGDKGGSSP